MRSTMLKIFPVETHKDIQIARTLFVEYAEFLKKNLSEYKESHQPFVESALTPAPGRRNTFRAKRISDGFGEPRIRKNRGPYCKSIRAPNGCYLITLHTLS